MKGTVGFSRARGVQQYRWLVLWTTVRIRKVHPVTVDCNHPQVNVQVNG